jgi:hypothetical protein
MTDFSCSSVSPKTVKVKHKQRNMVVSTEALTISILLSLSFMALGGFSCCGPKLL